MPLKSINQNHVPDSRQANRAETAEFFGVSQNTIQNWMQRGCPYMVRGEPGKPWVFDLLAVAKWRYGRTGDDETGDDPEQLSPKERLDYYKGCRERDAHKRESGELIHVDDVTAAWTKTVGIVKNRLMSLPMRLSPNLISMSELREIEDALKEGIFGALEELSGVDVTAE